MEHITAKVSCFARAYHNEKNPYPVFADDKAKRLLGAEYDQIAQSMTDGISFFLPGFQGASEEGLRLIVDRQLSPSVLGRSAYCEAKLEQEKRLGCGQYVIFASGYDTYAIRNKDATLSVYELDLPEVLADKRKKIENAGWETSAVSIPCDLAEASWREKLLAAGYLPHRKALGSLLGISYYFNKEEWKALIASIGKLMTKGSAICLDYPSENEGREATVNQALAQGAGEEMKARYTYAEMERLLAECGFLIYEHLDDAEMSEQFFASYNRRNPEHPLTAPVGVGYLLAVKE